MGEVTATPWEQFTGAERLFPVEYLVQSLEIEYTDPVELCFYALRRVSSDFNYPAGMWKSQNIDEKNWKDLKASLLNSFGRNGKPYSLEDKLEFMLSLKN